MLTYLQGQVLFCTCGIRRTPQQLARQGSERVFVFEVMESTDIKKIFIFALNGSDVGVVHTVVLSVSLRVQL